MISPLGKLHGSSKWFWKKTRGDYHQSWLLQILQAKYGGCMGMVPLVKWRWYSIVQELSYTYSIQSLQTHQIMSIFETPQLPYQCITMYFHLSKVRRYFIGTFILFHSWSKIHFQGNHLDVLIWPIHQVEGSHHKRHTAWGKIFQFRPWSGKDLWRSVRYRTNMATFLELLYTKILWFLMIFGLGYHLFVLDITKRNHRWFTTHLTKYSLKGSYLSPGFSQGTQQGQGHRTIFHLGQLGLPLLVVQRPCPCGMASMAREVAMMHFLGHGQILPYPLGGWRKKTKRSWAPEFERRFFFIKTANYKCRWRIDAKKENWFEARLLDIGNSWKLQSFRATKMLVMIDAWVMWTQNQFLPKKTRWPCFKSWTYCHHLLVYLFLNLQGNNLKATAKP